MQVRPQARPTPSFFASPLRLFSPDGRLHLDDLHDGLGSLLRHIP
jgi:hypothetical protein